MNDVVAAYPDTAIHVVLDNLSTHKPKNDRWLKRHPNVQFHFTPTRASWAQPSGDLVSRSCKESLCTVALSPRSISSGSTSMPSSTPITKPPSRSSGQSPRSTKNVSNLVSRISDSGY